MSAVRTYTCPMPSGLPPRSVAPSARSVRHHRRYAACNARPNCRRRGRRDLAARSNSTAPSHYRSPA
jgi:hypothetical protein